MNLFKTIISYLILFCFFSTSNAGDIKGTVKYDGKPPKKKPLRMDADPVCGAAHSGKVFSESFKVNASGELAECIVYLKNVKYNGGVPSGSVELDQKGCIYTPHVFGIQAGQELLIKNSDATLHNIHSMPKKNKEFNFAMPKVVKTKKAKFDSSEDPFYIKCDVHPWMKTWVLVSDHPYFAVTDSDGKYEIKGVPAGTYEVVCWQEKFKKKAIVETITVGDGEVTKNFTFTRPKKK
tara:strand:- start:450 stop:1157 length:708 start_codon:yes stop_codon:yes gene_type:complete